MKRPRPTWAEYRILKHMRMDGFYAYKNIYWATLDEYPMPNFNAVLNDLHTKGYVKVCMLQGGIFISPCNNVLAPFWTYVQKGTYENETQKTIRKT